MSSVVAPPQTSPAGSADVVSLRLAVETPENVILTYDLAGPGQRIWAYSLDLAVRGAILAFVALSLTCLGLMTNLPGLSQGVILIMLFLLEWGYFVVCEVFFNGRSIGKKAMGLRVIHEQGYTITVWGSMLRNLMRVVDGMPLTAAFVLPRAMFPVYGVGLVFLFCSSKLQRAGDMAAGTIVIRERAAHLPREPIILEKIDPIPSDQIGSGYRPSEQTLALIDEFLGRRYVLDYQRGHEIARELAVELAEKLDYRGDMDRVREFAMSFIAEVYVTFVRTDAAEDEPEDLPEFEAAPIRRPKRAGMQHW